MKPEYIFCKTASSLLIAAALLACTSCGKENEATTMNLVKTEGAVGVDNAKGKPLKLIENMGLYSGYDVGTQTESYAWINLDDVKLTKLDQDSKVAIEKEDNKLVIDVQSGSVFFNITEALGEDESMDIRTSTMIVGIRGTSGWAVEDGDSSSIALLHGKVEATLSTDSGTEDVTIGAMEVLNIEQNGDTVSYDVQRLEEVPDFVEAELANTPVTLFEILGVMEEHEVTLDEFQNIGTASDHILMNFCGKDSLNVLVPYIPDGWDGSHTLTLADVPPNFPSVNLWIEISVDANILMEVPDSEPEVYGEFLIWTDETPEDVSRLKHQYMYIAKSTSQPDDFGRYEALRFTLETRRLYEEDYWIPGRHIDDEVIKELFNAEYDMITSQLISEPR